MIVTGALVQFHGAHINNPAFTEEDGAQPALIVAVLECGYVNLCVTPANGVAPYLEYSVEPQADNEVRHYRIEGSAE